MKRLLIRPGAIGDFIVSLPALEHLRAGFTEVWTTEANLDLVHFADRKDTIVRAGLDALVLPESTLSRLGLFDEIVSWYGANRPDFRASVRHLPFRFFPALPPSGIHAVDFYLAQVNAPGGAVPRLPIAWRNEAYAVVHPFSGSPRKNWPIERFRALASELGMPVRWVAGPEEPLPEAERFDSLWDLAHFLAGASLYIGNDSGITHLAAACGVPTIAIFLTSDPAVWAPRGAHVAILRQPALDTVLKRCRTALGGGPG
ncbi:MAG: glycosyltransferase family 9 protein [Bryobacterales bacterium]|nr:glycosyltransferase family 9 protein [Bryobacterales bacterium]